MGLKHSVIPDISQDVQNKDRTIYYDNNWCTIYIAREDEPEILEEFNGNVKKKLENYKLYKHELPQNNDWWSVTYQLLEIHHGNKKQNWSEERLGLKDDKLLHVVYWLNDQYNLFPLIIGLGSKTNLAYYQRKGKTIDNTWEKANGIVHPATFPEYQQILCKLNENFKSIVIIRLHSTGPYCGHPSVKQVENNKRLCDKEFPKISVEVQSYNQAQKDFVKHTHRFTEDGPMLLLHALHNKTTHRFEKREISTECTKVHVYYSASDTLRSYPLITVLSPSTQGESEYYILDKTLVRSNSIKDPEILECLDEQNCRHNNIAVVDVSQKIDYCCKQSTSHEKRIKVTSNENVPPGYISFMHSANTAISVGTDSPRPSLCIHRFKDGKENCTLFDSGKAIDIYVYFCESHPDKPLLLYVYRGESSPGKWFKKIKKEGNNCWTEINTPLSKVKPDEAKGQSEICKVLSQMCGDNQLDKCKHSGTAAKPGNTSNENQSGATRDRAGGTGTGSTTRPTSGAGSHGKGRSAGGGSAGTRPDQTTRSVTRGQNSRGIRPTPGTGGPKPPVRRDGAVGQGAKSTKGDTGTGSSNIQGVNKNGTHLVNQTQNTGTTNGNAGSTTPTRRNTDGSPGQTPDIPAAETPKNDSEDRTKKPSSSTFDGILTLLFGENNNDGSFKPSKIKIGSAVAGVVGTVIISFVTKKIISTCTKRKV